MYHVHSTILCMVIKKVKVSLFPPTWKLHKEQHFLLYLTTIYFTMSIMTMELTGSNKHLITQIHYEKLVQCMHQFNQKQQDDRVQISIL